MSMLTYHFISHCKRMRHGVDSRLASLDRPGHVDLSGNRARHRQYHLYFNSRRQIAEGAAGPGQADRPGPGDDYPYSAAAVVDLDRPLNRATVYGLSRGHFRARVDFAG